MEPITDDILDIFEGFKMPPLKAGDLWEEKGKPKLRALIDDMVTSRTALRFSMLGYPMKSPNDRDKVLGKLPDLGEALSFQQFARFAKAVGSIYRPGVRYSFISDGFIFSDIMQTPDAVVEAYLERNKELARAVQLPVVWYDARDFYTKGVDLVTLREKIMSQYGITQEELQRRILFDENVNQLYKGMLYFMEGDLAIREFPSRNQLHKQSKIVAREMMFRNEAYSALIAANFSDHIRLSMHPSPMDGTKYSFQMIQSPNARHSPWHSAILQQKDNTVITIHKKEAIEAGHELVDVNGQPYYFQEV